MDGSDVRQKTYSVNRDLQTIEADGVEVSIYGAITWLYCDNNQLTALDVSKNVSLTELNCNSNQLTALDVSKNTALNYLECYANQLITTLSIASAYGNASVSTALATLITDATSTTGTLKIYGGDNTTVHTAATTKGWTVNTNL